jgi:hypothetical protein
METLLQKATLSDVRTDPYPYLVLTEAVSQELCDQLLTELPSIETLTHHEPLGNNKRFDYTVADIAKKGGVTPTWRAFIEAQSSELFWKQLIALFKPSIQKLYPDLEQKFGPLETWHIGHRYLDSFDDKTILLDAHISINTPVVKKPSSVREAHVDDPRKLFGALFYLRLPGDTTEGGNLQVFRYKDKNKKKFFGQGISEKYMEVVETVPYKKNVFVLFINHLDSVHGVTPREVTNVPRYFVNLIGEMKEPLFDLESVQENIWKRRVRSFVNTHFKEPHA